MSTAVADKLVTKFRDMAERMQGEIDSRRADRRENTPKQQKEAHAQRIEADRLERVQRALLCLASAREEGTLPNMLADVKTKADLYAMLGTEIDTSGGYYSLRDTGKFRDQSERAKVLRLLMERGKTETDKAAAAERERLEKIKQLEYQVKFSDIPGFFPTPPDVIRTMLGYADVRRFHDVLEPSAGKGDIADAIVEGREGVKITVVERNYTLCDILAAKGYQPVRGDFMETELGYFDRIVMNPPFENGQDIDHVRRAASILRDGGRLVAIMSLGPWFRKDKKCVEFREWLDSVDHQMFNLDEGAFKNAFRSTSVATRMIVIEK